MPRIYCWEDCNLPLLEGKTITVVGYGNQGHTHVLNLKESGCNVIVGLYEDSRSQKEIEEQGFEVHTAAEASKKVNVTVILINDKKQAAVYKESIASDPRPGVMLMLAHGFAIHFGQIVPPKDAGATMITPKAPGHTVRSEYQRGRGTPCLAAVYQDATGRAMDMALTYEWGAGDARAGIPETISRVETETDLFGGQAVLYGNVHALMRAGSETLAEAGYTPESACSECVHEMKLIVGLIYESDFVDMRYSTPNTAEYGDCITGSKIVIDKTEKVMRKILFDIQDDSFVKEWSLGNQVGCPHFDAMKENEAEQLLKKVGAELRKLYSWNDTDKLINN